MPLYSLPPSATPFSEAKPQLLVAWWITLFSTSIILLRLAGRYVRVERLFAEDKVVAAALLPLYLRMGCVHMVYLYGTNNVDLAGLELSDRALARRVTGSQLVLASRIFYAATLWVLKFATVEFLARLNGSSRRDSYMRIIAGLRWALGIAFAAIVVSDLAECQPVSHYWQVTPDPGPQCRQGMAQLLTTGVASAVADVVLVLFPIPMVWRSRIALRRKLFLVLLFCFGFVTVGVTLYRVPAVVRDHGDQTRRSTWASVEILAATAVANIVALGSFLRDTGVKKKRYRHDGGYAYSSSAAAAADSSRRMTRGTMVSAAAEWEATLNQNQGVLRAKTTAQAWARDVDSAEDDSGASGHHGLDTEDQQQQQEQQRYSKASSTARPASPAGSNASLIQSHQAYQTGSAAVVDPHPRPPSPVVQAPLRRGS